jgi:hypothetical protein
MNLHKVGTTCLPPETTFYWEQDSSTTVEATSLGNGTALLRASKSYKLVKQDREGQENWDANLRNLNDYLAEAFPAFQISVNYVNEAVPEATGVPDEVRDAKGRAEELFQQQATLEAEAENHRRSAELGVEKFEDTLKTRAREKKDEAENIDRKLDRLITYLERKKQEIGEWKRNGVMMAYTFSFSTEPEIVPSDTAEQAAEEHVGNASNYHRRKVKQTLQGTNWKLVVEDVEKPRMLNRLEHTTLLNPESFGRLTERNPDLEEPLETLRRETLAQYEAFALHDLEIDNTVFERSKATPAQAVNGLLQGLESENVAQTREAPNDGPYIGTLAGTQQVVGFDPAEKFDHVYLAGKTGSGKTYLKRTILENAASLGYNVLSVVPTDKQGIAASFPNPENENGRALNADQYWPENQLLLDWPGDVGDLLHGTNFVTLHGVGEQRRGTLLGELFDAAYNAEYPGDEPLFLFVEEAQNVTGDAKDVLKQIVKQKRKHNIHVVIVTQNPMEFKRNYADIRRNTATICLRGEYSGYADDLDHLESKREVTSLDKSQAILYSMDLPKLTVDIRTPLSKVEEPSEAEIRELDRRYRRNRVELPQRSMNGEEAVTQPGMPELSEEQEVLLDWIHRWLATHPEHEYVTASNCHRPDGAPGSPHTVKDELEAMEERGVLAAESITRNYNEATGYRPVSDSPV